MNDIYADFHVHTHFSPCGRPEASVAAMVARAKAKGLAALGFADHVTPQPVPGCGFYDGQQANVVADLRAAVAALGDAPGLPLSVGVEADYTLAGEGCLSEEILAQIDHVVCSASHFHLPAAPRPEDDSNAAKARLMVRMAREMLQVPAVQIWAHPFDCSKMRPLAPIMAEIGDATLAELIQLANDRDIAVEINGGPAIDVAYREATAPFFQLAHEMGARFTMTADAHHPDDFERLDLAFAWAREMELPEHAFLTLSELRAGFRQKLADIGIDERS